MLFRSAVDATGAVTDARVVTPVGEGFDEAAVAAARSFRFSPAIDAQGQPAAAIIQYRYRFVVARAVPPSVEGVLLDRTAGLPFSGIEVRAVAADGTTAFATTDGDGRFVFSGLPAGAWRIVATPPRHLAVTAEVEVREGNVAELKLDAEPEPERVSGEVLTVQAERAATEITERTLTQEEIRYLPGTGGDVVKVVQNLPGVARAPLGVGQLIIREIGRAHV